MFLEMNDHLLSACHVCASCAVALGAGFFRRRSDAFRFAALVASGVVVLLTVSFSSSDVWIRFGVVMFCSLFPVKLIDAVLRSAAWRDESFRRWAWFVINPVFITKRMMDYRPDVSSSSVVRNLLRGALEVAAGVVLWNWICSVDRADWPFAVRYVGMLAASYLFLWDGGCVSFVACWRALGGNVLDFSVHPILAKTPAEFWRRYNRWLGLYCRENIFLKIDGLKRPFVGIMASFAVMGAFHEYLITLISQTLTGYVFAFFILQGVAVGLTFRAKPKGVKAVFWWMGTVAFLTASSYLIYLTIRQFHAL